MLNAWILSSATVFYFFNFVSIDLYRHRNSPHLQVIWIARFAFLHSQYQYSVINPKHCVGLINGHGIAPLWVWPCRCSAPLNSLAILTVTDLLIRSMLIYYILGKAYSKIFRRAFNNQSTRTRLDRNIRPSSSVRWLILAFTFDVS